MFLFQYQADSVITFAENSFLLDVFSQTHLLLIKKMGIKVELDKSNKTSL